MIKPSSIPRQGLLLTCLSILTACAPPAAIQPEQPTTTINQAQRNPQHISRWNLSGAVAAKNKKKTWSASINWQQQSQNDYEIRLFGPLGGGTVLIEKHGAHITYHDGPRTVTSQNPDKLFLQETGIDLPVSTLFYWIRGVPAPGKYTSTTNHTGQLESLTQAGYVLHYTEYTTVNQMTLPTKIKLEGHGGMIKLIIKHWEIQG